MSAAFLIVDMINEFFYGQPDGRLIPVESIPVLVSNVRMLIEKGRQARVPVVFIACAHDEDDPIFRSIPAHALRGTWNAQIISDLAPVCGDPVVTKKTYDGFYETQLDDVLQRLGVDTVYLAGVQTDCCVHSTGQGAIFRGYHTALIAECTDTISPERKRLGLERFRDLIGPILSLNDLAGEAQNLLSSDPWLVRAHKMASQF
jgi:nicotinamidase-related amidase